VKSDPIIYPLVALLSGFLFGTNNFLYHQATSNMMTIKTLYPAGFGLITLFIFYHTYFCVNSYKEKGYLWSRSNSCYFKSGDKSVNWTSVIVIIARIGVSFYGLFGVFFVIRTSIEAEINSSIIFSLIAGCILTTSLAFYFIYGERLHRKHIIGMCFMIVAIIFISVSHQ
jgi:drug/metabolite transporter (DMT)-like permease